ncbi:MAG TPA: cell wall-binding repeat-containing protein [Acidimicrobiales bacterium]|nr:cell wall-binding repeat-containing protein [Acidimicrobiales bacterium]
MRTAALGMGLSTLLAVAGGPAQGENVAGRVVDNTKFGTSTDPLRGRDIPGLAVDPADPNHIVMIDEDFLAGQCDFHVTFDAGKTWKDGHLTVPTGFADPPCRTFDAGGYAHYNQSVVFGSGQNVYTTFASHRGDQERPETNVVAGEGDSVIVNHSGDGGKTWDTGVVALQGGPGPWPFIIRPGVAVQPRPQGDKVYAVGWSVVNPPGMGASGGAGDRKAVVSSSDDGGKTWSAPVEAQGPDEHVREIAPPVVGPDGSLYIAWRNRDDPSTAPHPIVVAKSSDGGATFTRTSLGNVGPAPTTAPAPAGSAGYPRMAVDAKSGALYVVYVGFNFGDLDAILQSSTDGGATWSPPKRVNDDPMGNGARQLGPKVAVAPNGRVDVAWFDARAQYPSTLVPKPAGGGDIYYASSTDGGKTFSANRRISDRSINLDDGLTGRTGTYTWWGPALAPIGNDSVLFAWGDPRNGNVDSATNDVYTATLRLGQAGPEEVTALPKASPANESVAVSQLAYPGGAERIGANFTSKLVVVNKNDVAGAWAGAVLARANSSPLLVTDGSSLTKAQKDEIKRLNPTGMFVIGDTKSIPDSLVNSIKSAGVITNLSLGATTTVPPTTAAPTTTAVGAPTTTTTVPTPTADRASIIRLTGATPADIGKAVAGAMDVRSDQEKGRAVPAFNGAVAVNAASKESAAGLAFAASQRLPVLFVDKDGVPAATADTFNAMNIQTTYVIGGTDAISDAVMGKLPGAKRLGGADTAATSVAVNNEVKARGLSVNIAYVADASRPVDAAVSAAAVARVGGMELLTPGADTAAADTEIGQLGLTGAVDKMVVVKSATSSSPPWALIVISALLAAVGIFLLDRASRKKRANDTETAAMQAGTAPASPNTKAKKP